MCINVFTSLTVIHPIKGRKMFKFKDKTKYNPQNEDVMREESHEFNIFCC